MFELVLTFFSFFLLQKIYIVLFIIVMQVFARVCWRRLSYSQALLYKYLNLQYSVLVIYDESKAIHERPSHGKVSKKRADNWQGSTSRRSVILTKLLLCVFIEITLRHGYPPPPLDLSHMPKKVAKTKHLRGVASNASTTHSSLMLETYTSCDTIQ